MALQSLFSGSEGMLLSLLNFFSGAGWRRWGSWRWGVYPHITASIIMQLLTPIIPQLEELQKEGEQGRHKLNQYTYLMTVLLAISAGYRPGHAVEPSAQRR